MALALEAFAFAFCESSAAGFVAAAGTPSVVISTEDSSYCIFALLATAASIGLLGLDPIGADSADSAADPWTPTFASSSESDNTTIGTQRQVEQH